MGLNGGFSIPSHRLTLSLKFMLLLRAGAVNGSELCLLKRFVYGSSLAAARGADPNHSHAVRFAVADEDRAVAVNEDAVRTRHLARQRIAIRSVSFGAGSRDQFNCLFANVNHSDRMAFGVGQIDIAVWRDTQTFRAGQSGQPGRAAIPSESFLSGSRNV